MQPQGAMQTTVSQMQGSVPVAVLHLHGLINLGTAETLQQKAQEAINAGARNLLLDMTDVSSLTSAGLRAIQIIVKSLDAAWMGGKPGPAPRSADGKSLHLKLLNPKPQIQQVLDISGFSHYLEIHHDLQEAVASF